MKLCMACCVCLLICAHCGGFAQCTGTDILPVASQIRWTDPHFMLTLEQAIAKGKPVLIKNCEEVIDNFITPLMHHSTMGTETGMEEEPQMLMFCGRRILCQKDFKFYLSTHLPKPRFSAHIASASTLINYSVSNETFIEDLLSRVFAQVCSDLYMERIKALKNIQLLKGALYHFSQIITNCILACGHNALLNNPKSLQFINSAINARQQLAEELARMQTILSDLDMLKDELYPVARRAALLYSVVKFLTTIRPEYQFTLKYFIQLFDEAVGGKLPAEFGHVEDEGYEDEESGSEKVKLRPTSQISKLSAWDPAAQDSHQKTAVAGIQMQASEEETKFSQHEGTEGESISVSTGAVHKLLYGSESEELPPLELPETVQLPTLGVQYSSLSVNRIKQLVESVTSLIFHRYKQSLLEEDQLLFKSMICLNIQSDVGEDFSSEEMSLFLQGNPGLGMQLNLSDFNSQLSPPSWLPQEKWDDIMALSVLPGPLDSVCVSMAAASNDWHKWYTAPYPEQEPLPLTESFRAQQNKLSSDPYDQTQQHIIRSPDLGPLSDFHHLLLLRMLRPDRLPFALTRYTDKHLNLNDVAKESMNITEMLNDAHRDLGILLLMSPGMQNQHAFPESRLKLEKSPVEMLVGIAKAVGVTLNRVIVGDGCQLGMEEAIDAADKNNTWVVIEDLHLASLDLLTAFRHQLQRIFKYRVSSMEPQQDAKRFCVWMTSETNSNIPSQLIRHLHKVSWMHLMMLSKTTIYQQDVSHKGTVAAYLSPKKYLTKAIVLTLRQVPSDVWIKVSLESNQIKRLAFAVGIIQGVLVARQLFGCTGLSCWYPFGNVQIINAISFILNKPLQSSDGSELNIEDLIYCIGHLVYGSVVSHKADAAYVFELVKDVLQSAYRNSTTQIMLGTTHIPTPPANVAPIDYADWFEMTAKDHMTLEALQLHTSVERQISDANSHHFLSNLYRMYNVQKLEVGDKLPVTSATININRLRCAIDLCLEKLPPMLEIGQRSQILAQENSFPYHRPSIISFNSAASDLMPKHIGYVLLQECLWMNSLFCYMRQQLADLQASMLGGPAALPYLLIPTAFSLQEEIVPVGWIHPNQQPCTHSLTSWLEDLVRCYNQLHGWVARKMVPTFTEDGESAETTDAHGHLTKVWLGGMTNPLALLTSVKREKGILAQISIDQIEFHCTILRSQDIGKFEMDENGLFVDDVYLQNADWSFEMDCLVESKSDLFHIPCLYLCPVTKSEHRSEEHHEVYNCPVFMNKSRQILVCYLPFRCSAPEKRWILANTALILDRGLPEGANKKSRSYLLLQRSLLVQHSEEEEEFIEEEDEDNEEELQDEQDSESSYPSQLSYKPMTPQASPLPAGLGLSRELPLSVNGQEDEDVQKKSGVNNEDAVEPPLIRSQSVRSSQQHNHLASASHAPRPPSQNGSTISIGHKQLTPKHSETLMQDSKSASSQQTVFERKPSDTSGTQESRTSDPKLSHQGGHHSASLINDEANSGKNTNLEKEKITSSFSKLSSSAASSQSGSGSTLHSGKISSRNLSASSQRSVKWKETPFSHND